jgi:hypothetical protein
MASIASVHAQLCSLTTQCEALSADHAFLKKVFSEAIGEVAYGFYSSYLYNADVAQYELDNATIKLDDVQSRLNTLTS